MPAAASPSAVSALPLSRAPRHKSTQRHRHHRSGAIFGAQVQARHAQSAPAPVSAELSARTRMLHSPLESQHALKDEAAWVIDNHEAKPSPTAPNEMEKEEGGAETWRALCLVRWTSESTGASELSAPSRSLSNCRCRSRTAEASEDRAEASLA
eukprot:1932463-Rhodomonas_salina.1